MNTAIHILLWVSVLCYMIPVIIPFLGPIIVTMSMLELILLVHTCLRVPIHWIWEKDGLTMSQAVKECSEIIDEGLGGIWGLVPALGMLVSIIMAILGYRLCQ